jgi:predicted RNA-binding Zn-ribbon protein involved in translation (DUF1610 family)
MPRVTKVHKTRKDQGTCPKCGAPIAIGAAYVWWQFKNCGRSIRCNKTECYPKPSELTRSEFLSTVLGLQESSFQHSDNVTMEDIETERDDVQSALEDLASELQEKHDNMPEGLQEGDTGQLLQERADSVQEAADALESVDCTYDNEEEMTDEQKQEKCEEVLTELQDALSGISC